MIAARSKTSRRKFRFGKAAPGTVAKTRSSLYVLVVEVRDRGRQMRLDEMAAPMLAGSVTTSAARPR